MVRVQQQQSTDLEQQHRLKQQKLQALDRALALRLDRIEQDTVAEMDLQREYKQCTALQEQVDELGELHYHVVPYV